MPDCEGPPSERRLPVLEFAINEQRNLRNEISQLMPFVVMDEAIAPDEKPAS